MTVNKSQVLEHHQESHDSIEVRENRAAWHASETSPSANAPMSASHESRPPSVPSYHTAFMQCRSCCNCDSACSYYGKGNFDPQGNYIGS